MALILKPLAFLNWVTTDISWLSRHEERIFWFNTLLFTQPDIARLPYFEPKKLARRAANFLLLGISLPSVVDLNTSSAIDYLRALNALMSEFEDFEKAHPVDGPSSTSLSRARIPAMFKRSNTNKRRTSSATDIGLPMQNSGGADSTELAKLLGSGGGGPAGGNFMSAANFGTRGNEYDNGDDYGWLRTPSLPFDPAFFEVLVTLCDVLIECYTRITTLVTNASMCVPEMGDAFAKADAKVRKVVFEGIVKDFVDVARAGAKNEVAGISKVILGGLMG